MLEEHLIRHEPRHGDDLPAGRRGQPGVDFVERGHAVGWHADAVDACQKLIAHTAFEQRGLACVKLLPDSMVDCAISLGRLVDGEIGTGFEAGVELLFEFGGVGCGHDAARSTITAG